MDNELLIKQLIPLWHAERNWAEQLLISAFNLEKPEDILMGVHRGRKSIPGTNWAYRTHGIGIDIYKTDKSGGIDFDFDKPDPDPWRLQIFLEKQYNEGNLKHAEYRHLFEDVSLTKTIINKVLA